jgi:Ca2+-binding RTX toxin-like protein
MVTKTGTAGADNLVGTDANDMLNGLGGNDQLMAGPAKGGTAMTRSSMILKMAALAMLAGSAALPAQASLTNNAIHPGPTHEISLRSARP